MYQVHNPPILELVLFAVMCTVVAYGLNCLIARELKKIDIKRVAVYIFGVAMIGVVGEVFGNGLYAFLFHQPLWSYTVYPVHHGYTSQYALFLWGIYGFHLYLLHGTLRKLRPSSVHRLAWLFCGEAILVEGVVNLAYLLCFGSYIYYYFPADLWHFTTVQTLPFYLAAGYLIVKSIRNFEVKPRFYAVLCAWVACVVVFLT